MILLLFILLHSVSSLNIRIDGDNGIDSIECLTEQPQSSCQSLKYVADTINNTGNLTIKIISSTLSLQGSVVFTDINGLTINGQGTSISCVNGSMLYGNSGIVFNKCSNVKLISFTIQHCGLLYEKEQTYYGRQGVLFYNCNNFSASKVIFSNNNGYGLALYDSSDGHVLQNIFLINSIKNSHHLSIKEKSKIMGGGLHIIQYKGYTSPNIISGNQFIDNSALTMGGAMHMDLSDCASFTLLMTGCSFIGNTAGTAGGAIAFIIHKTTCNYNGTIPLGFHININNCSINNNMAKFGGGVAIQIVHYDSKYHDAIKHKAISFESCYFTGNKAAVSSAVDINGRSQKIYQSLTTVVRFEDCYFNGNVAGINNNQCQLRGQLFKATLFVSDAIVTLIAKISFANNTGTALYAVNSRVLISHRAHIRFFNNIGDLGGAIFLTEEAVLDFNEHSSSLIEISKNKALLGLGGAIFIQSMMNVQYEGTCFLSHQDWYPNIRFQFLNNTAISGFGHDIFASTLEPCVQFYGENTSTLFKTGKMGKFNFSSLTPSRPPVATAPVTMFIIETEVAPYPGIPYNIINLTQIDEFNNTITNLQLFPLSATLQNEHNSSLKIDLTHSIANNYIIVFTGTVGDKATLLLQTTEYSARLFINITLYQCPPGYTFQTDTCHCYGIYYYGVSGCLENSNAVIDTGLWAGYIDENFATADCVTSLCDYHNSESNRHREHILPLNYSLLNDHVCALHRNGVLCGSCINGYTTYLHSPTYHCGESTHCQYGPLLYIVSEIIPVTGIFLVILFFNINLTSGALYSLIFYSQIVNNHYGNTIYQSYNGPLIYLFHAFKIIYGIFDLEIFEIDQLSFCLFKDATIMDLMLIKYLTTLYALLLMIITILVLKFNSFHCCIKLCHKCGRRNIRGSIVNALTAFLVLCYFHCLAITLHILVPSYVMGGNEVRLKTVPLYNGDMSYMSDDHLKYVTPAIICLMVIILPPPIILLSEPLLVRVSGVLNIRRNAITYTLHRLRMKLKPFLDSFQGCFKDNCRCFAGLFFLYRILLVLIPSTLTGGTISDFTKEILLFLILLLHCFYRPFENNKYNKLDSFLLINLLLITIMHHSSLNDSDISGISLDTIAAVLQLLLMTLPLLYLVYFILRHFIKMKCSAAQVLRNDCEAFPARLLEHPNNYNTFNSREQK